MPCLCRRQAGRLHGAQPGQLPVGAGQDGAQSRAQLPGRRRGRGQQKGRRLQCTELGGLRPLSFCSSSIDAGPLRCDWMQILEPSWRIDFPCADGSWPSISHVYSLSLAARATALKSSNLPYC